MANTIARSEGAGGGSFEFIKILLRGTGQVLGVRQSGFDQCVDDMLKNPELYQSIRALIRRRAQKRLAGPDNA